jgi:hypothetical protein
MDRLITADGWRKSSRSSGESQSECIEVKAIEK